MPRSLLLLAALSLLGCSGERLSPAGSDGAAVGVCRAALAGTTDAERLATTVRDEGDGYVVHAWRHGTPDEVPDVVCTVARDDAADRGVRVVDIRPSP